MYQNPQTRALALSEKGLLPNLEVMQNRSLTPAAAVMRSTFRQIGEIIKSLLEENKELKRKLDSERFLAKSVPSNFQAPVSTADFSKFQASAIKPID